MSETQEELWAKLFKLILDDLNSLLSLITSLTTLEKLKFLVRQDLLELRRLIIVGQAAGYSISLETRAQVRAIIFCLSTTLFDA
jgi:hypothetical protein